MATKVFFDTSYSLEFEVFHDSKFPHLQLGTGEIISVPMAARILYLLKNKHNFSCIPCHLKEEFNIDISKESLEGLLERDFDVTDRPLTGGQELIPIQAQNRRQGFVDGHFIPSGIYYEIINLRTTGANFIQQYASVRWGFRVPARVIAEAIDRWSARIAAAVPFVLPPADVRPGHDGHLLAELPTHPSLIDRSSFSNNPPPLYSPPPVFQNARGQRIVLRHPRQIDPIYPQGDAPAPAYFEGNAPPSYEACRNDQGLGQRPSRAETTNQRMVEQEPQSSNAMMPMESKPRHFEEPLIKYSRQNVVDYLFDGMHHTIIYPVSPFEPVRLPAVSWEFRRMLVLTTVQRTRKLTPAEMFPDFAVDNGPDISLRGQSISSLIASIMREFYHSSCALSRHITSDAGILVNRQGLVFLLDHMRAARGAQSMGTVPGYDSIWQAVIEELQLSDNMHVRQVMGQYQNSPPAIRLGSIIQEIAAARKADPAITLVVREDWDAPCPRLSVAFPNVRVPPTFSFGQLARDFLKTFTGVSLEKYRQLLRQMASLLQAMIESTTSDGFQASKRNMEKFLCYAIKSAINLGANPTQTIAQLEAVCYRVRALASPAEVFCISPEWWAASLTNAALALLAQFADSRAWLTIPDAEIREWSQYLVAVPVQSRPTEFSLELHNRKLEEMKFWARIIQRHYAPMAQRGIIDGYYRSYEMLMAQRAADRASTHPVLNNAVLERLEKEYTRGLSLLWHLQDRFQVAASVVDAERRAELEGELKHHEQIFQAFTVRLGANKAIPFADELDFKEVEFAIVRFSHELDRLRPWYRQAGQVPLQPPTIDAAAARVEQAFARLEAERTRLPQATNNSEGERRPEQAVFDQIPNAGNGQREQAVPSNDVPRAAASTNYAHEDSLSASIFPRDLREMSRTSTSIPTYQPAGTNASDLPSFNPSGHGTLVWLAENVRRRALERRAEADLALLRQGQSTTQNIQGGSSSADHDHGPDDGHNSAARGERQI